MRKYYLSIAVLIFFLLVTSCKITRPSEAHLTMPGQYLNKGDSNTIADINWPEFFNDSCLVDLIHHALENNFQRKKAMQRTIMTRATVKTARGAMLPEISGFASTNVKKFGAYSMDQIGNDDTNGSERLTEDQKIPSPYKEFTGGAAFSWELDVWGKLTRQKQSAKARWAASVEEQYSITTWLVAEVASLYYELEGLDKEKEALLQNLSLQKRGLELIIIQKEGGKVNQLAVDQFEAQLLNTNGILFDINQKIILAESDMNKLLGRYPEAICRGDISRTEKLKMINAGIPAALLRNRPDIRQAEWEMIASHADVYAARAAFFPSLRLFGYSGVSSFDWSKLFLMPESSIYQLGAGLVAPIFQRNQLRALYNTAKANQQTALINYQQTVMNSYYEVFTTLSAYSNLDERIRLKQEEVVVQKRFMENFNSLFSVGYNSFIEVIVAQQKLLEAELALVHLKKEQLQSVVIVYRALGGGWNKKIVAEK